jgi:hypothetical protein
LFVAAEFPMSRILQDISGALGNGQNPAQPLLAALLHQASATRRRLPHGQIRRLHPATGPISAQLGWN